MNGKLLGEDEAWLSPQDRGFTYGDGLFETIRVYQGVAFDLQRHLERLGRGAAFLGIPDVGGWEEAARVVIAANGLKEGSLRLALSRGVGPRGLLAPSVPMPTRVAMVGFLGSPPPRVAIKGVIVQGTRRNEFSPLTGLKTASSLDLVLARREAAQRGAMEGILLNSQGFLTEGSHTNLFFVEKGIIQTPQLSAGVLPGVVRSRVMELAGNLGLTISERIDAKPEELLGAAEAFLTNSLLEVVPLTEVDGKPIGAGLPGPMTLKLLAEYRRLVAPRV